MSLFASRPPHNEQCRLYVCCLAFHAVAGVGLRMGAILRRWYAPVVGLVLARPASGVACYAVRAHSSLSTLLASRRGRALRQAALARTVYFLLFVAHALVYKGTNLTNSPRPPRRPHQAPTAGGRLLCLGRRGCGRQEKGARRQVRSARHVASDGGPAGRRRARHHL